jgi:molybdate transport system regulatory protein
MAPPTKSSRLSIRIVLPNSAILGPTKIALLEAIAAKGSITVAARSLEISRNYAWLSVQSINGMLRSPAVVTETGGRQHGGAKLTATGKQVVAIYHAIQTQAYNASFHELHALTAMTRKRKPPVEPIEKL